MESPCLGCGAPTRSAYCRECEAARPGGRARLRTRAWRRRRAAYVRLHPTCEWPECWQPTAEVDHKVPRDQGGSDAPSNLQALCKEHHARKTRQDVAP